MKEVSISEFEAKCTEWLEHVQKTRETIRVVRAGKTIAEIVAVKNATNHAS